MNQFQKACYGRMVDALAQKVDEGRCRLRKASGSCQTSVRTRRCPNGVTLLESCPVTVQ